MSMIQVTDLTFSYGGSADLIFDHCSLNLDTEWRLGLIGRNGRGKTTFLRILMGELPYEGEIRHTVSFRYFPYRPDSGHVPALEIMEHIFPGGEEWQFMKELSQLHADPDLLWRFYDELSPGEQTKVQLAAYFCRQDAFQLIDEPANHLDQEARQQIAAYLRQKSGFILVSHDRAFLDACTDHTLSINRADITVQAGGYSVWKENFDRVQAEEEARSVQLKKEIRRLRSAAERTAVWADRTEAGKYGDGHVDRGFIGHKSAAMMKRSKAIAARRQKAADEKAALLKNREYASALQISGLSHHSRTLVSFRDVSVSYDGTPVCGPLTFDLMQGEKTALCGKNGCGKSSLLKLITGSPIPHTGTVRTAAGLVISYVPQESAFLKGSVRHFAGQRGIPETLLLTILRKMDFPRAMFEKDMEAYSAGQLRKVLLAASLCEKAHLYIWDEPLNYIDLYSRVQLEDMLMESGITLLFVEHDSTFTDRIAGRRIIL